MKKLAVLAVILGLMAVAAPQAQAHGWGFCGPSGCCPPCPPQVCYRIECVPIKCTIQVPRCVNVERVIRVCVPECQWVEREVCCTRYVAVDCVDSCGCHYCCYQPQCYTTVVRCPVYTCRYEPRVVMCPTVVYEPCVVVRHVYRCVAVPCCNGAP